MSNEIHAQLEGGTDVRERLLYHLLKKGAVVTRT